MTTNKLKVICTFQLEKKLLEQYKALLKDMDRTVSEDLRRLVQLRICSSEAVRIEDRMKIAEQINKEEKKK